jgi:hypothetical protein
VTITDALVVLVTAPSADEVTFAVTGTPGSPVTANVNVNVNESRERDRGRERPSAFAHASSSRFCPVSFWMGVMSCTNSMVPRYAPAGLRTGK